VRIVRVEHQGEIFHGILEDQRVTRITGNLFSDFQVIDQSYQLKEVKLLAPLVPVNIIAIGLNYRKHAIETGKPIPTKPVIFLKATSSLIGPEEPIRLPKQHADEVDFEAELAIVIGKIAKDLSPEEALDYVLGYTCANDVSARDCQHRLDVQWARGKSFDTFCPLGPWIETELDPNNQGIRTRINGITMQDSNTQDMIFSVKEIISYCSQNMTLLPGTVILTGTPEGVGTARKPPVYLKDGDIVEVEIEGIGVLRNSVIK